MRELIQPHEANHKYHDFKHHILQTILLPCWVLWKKKKRKKTLLLSLSSSYLPFSFKITQKCNSLCFLSSGFNFPQDKRKKPTNLRLNLFAQSWISLINKVEENRSIAVPERVFTFAGVLTCANSCLLRTWNDFKEWTSIPSVCPF